MIFYIFFALVLIGAIFCAVRMATADFKRRIIPDVYLFPFLFAGLLTTTFFPWPVTISDSVIGGAMGYCLGLIVGFIFDKIKQNEKYFSNLKIEIFDFDDTGQKIAKIVQIKDLLLELEKFKVGKPAGALDDLFNDVKTRLDNRRKKQISIWKNLLIK